MSFFGGGGSRHAVISLHCPTALRRELEELREESRRLEEDTEREEDMVPSTT